MTQETLKLPGIIPHSADVTLIVDLFNSLKFNSTEVGQVIWVTQLLNWIVRPRTQDEKKLKAETIYSTRIKYLLAHLERDPRIKKQVAETFEFVFLRLLTPNHIAYTGLSSATSFQQELFERIEEKILPAKPLSASFESLLLESFPDGDESVLIDHVNCEMLFLLIETLGFSQSFRSTVFKNTLSAGHRVSLDLVQIAELLRQGMNLSESDFYSTIEFKIESMLRAEVMENGINALTIACAPELFEQIQTAESDLVEMVEGHHKHGIKIEIVYGLQSYRKRAQRLRLILQMLQAGSSRYDGIRNFLSQSVLDVHQQKSLLSFLAENFALLTRRIVQTNSAVGEHYVTHTWKDFTQMFLSSLGGGAVTVLTVMIKHGTGQIGATGFIKGLVDSLNYSTSFLLIQSLGFTLATKQPSATALHLAQALKKSLGESRRTIVALLRTQFIAVMGNFIAVTPICFLVGWIAFRMGMPLYTVDEVNNVIESSNYLGFAPFFAAITGILLFLSSLIAGWFENFSLSKDLPGRIQENPVLLRWFGGKRTKLFASLIEHNSSAVAANFSLGILLGLVPQFVKFLGIPIEVRHITLASGSYFSALFQALQMEASRGLLLNSFLGLFVIGFLNISISFILAFTLASIATQVSLHSLMRTLFWGLKLVLTKPWLLLIPENRKSRSQN
jgi:site-specific recombinase